MRDEGHQQPGRTEPPVAIEAVGPRPQPSLWVTAAAPPGTSTTASGETLSHSRAPSHHHNPDLPHSCKLVSRQRNRGGRGEGVSGPSPGLHGRMCRARGRGACPAARAGEVSEVSVTRTFARVEGACSVDLPTCSSIFCTCVILEIREFGRENQNRRPQAGRRRAPPAPHVSSFTPGPGSA